MNTELHPPEEIVAAYEMLSGCTFRRLGTGLINATFLAQTRDESWVLQGLHPAFAGVVNDDIAALTTHLRSRGMTTPEILPTRHRSFWHADATGRPWRVLTYIDGDAFDKIDSPQRAFEAGKLVGRFHTAVSDFTHTYAFTRPGVHDGPMHLEKLRSALEAHRDHRYVSEVSTLAVSTAEILEALTPKKPLGRRHAHGDLKLSNLLFDKTGAGLCLIDLDTIATMPLMFELGDALRSWTNPQGEDVTDATVDRAIFENALAGFAETFRGLTHEERESMALGLPYIAAGLTARFLTDVLEERYFGWRSDRYATRADHNLVRAKGQLSLAKDAMASRVELTQIARRALG